MAFVLNRFTLTSACIATASRLVGASFRVAEAYHPRMQQRGVTLNPQVVLQREAITLGLGWGFALLTATGMQKLTRRLKMGRSLGLFLTSVIGTVLAETLGRAVAYRQLESPPAPVVGGAVGLPRPQTPSLRQPTLAGAGRMSGALTAAPKPNVPQAVPGFVRPGPPVMMPFAALAKAPTTVLNHTYV